MILLAVPPNVTVTSSASGPVLEDEDSVSLNCEVDSNPESEIAWRKEGNRKVLSSSPLLELGLVSRTDIGTYTCTATNPLGSDTSSVDVITHCKQGFILYYTNKLLLQILLTSLSSHPLLVLYVRVKTL